jgi:N-acetylglucosaminyldiphosphoundecaprenol N-acetyl-beta-D-mannosaminyltransferase
LRERVSGSGLFEHLRLRARETWRVFFFGGPPGVGEKACSVLSGGAQPMRSVGYLYPGFGSVEDMSRQDWIDQINASGADFVVVSLGSAKGQAWISRNLDRLQAPVVSHLGAVVNFVAGTVKRAPVWMQRTGLEWLWRIKEEPQLWKRYAQDGLAMLRLLVTRVLPLAVLQRRRAPTSQELGRAAVTRPPGTTGAVAALHGAWRADNLVPVRDAMTALFAQGGDVTLDLSDTTGVDSAFAGLLLLLDTALQDQGRRLHLRGVQPLVARLLSLQGAAPHPLP